MELWTLRKAIGETWDDHWHKLEIGPYFHDGFGEVISQKGRYLEHNAHMERAVLTSDVDISLEWGLSLDGNRDTVSIAGYGWDFHFPDNKIRREFIDIFYRGALVDRLLVLDVDGGRATLPIADMIDGEWTVHGWEYDIVALVDSLSGGRDFKRYFDQTGWRVLR